VPLRHGTHTAGTALGLTSGVAKCATLVPVQILDGEGKGSSSDILSAGTAVNKLHSVCLHTHCLHTHCLRVTHSSKPPGFNP
jgi:hypothetical protein